MRNLVVSPQDTIISDYRLLLPRLSATLYYSMFTENSSSQQATASDLKKKIEDLKKEMEAKDKEVEKLKKQVENVNKLEQDKNKLLKEVRFLN